MAKMPHHIKPMLAVLVPESFDKKGWIFEPKWDGYRAIAEIKKNKIELYSRNLLSFNSTYPQVVEELQQLGIDSAILDGEIIIVDSKGRSQFQMMQNYKRLQKGKVLYYVFDLLYLNGYDLRDIPLIKRKSLLKQLVSGLKTIRFTPFIKEKGKAYFAKAKKKNLEGIIGKDAESSYVMRRSSEWVKIKTHQRQEVVICGFTAPQGSRNKFGALLVGVYEKGQLRFCGKVGGGFSEETLSQVYAELKGLVQEKCPFKNVPKIKATWVKPKLVCEVSFAEWTSDGKLRQPIFKGLRIDKKAKQVKRERARRG